MNRSDISISCNTPEEHERIKQAIFARKRLFWGNGGMGVRLSTPELVIAVMRAGGIGTLSGSAPGFNARMREILSAPTFDERKVRFRAANREMMEKDIAQVRADPKAKHGMLAVNILEPMLDFRDLVDVVGSTGEVDLLYPAAGLPRYLPEQMDQYPRMKYAPLVSGPRAADIMLKAAKKSGGRPPDAFYVESPETAGGHLGAKDDKDAMNLEPVDPANPTGPKKFDMQVLHDQIRAVVKEYGLDIPLIWAGGITCQEDAERAYAAGFDGVSIGTALLMASESGLSDDIYFKHYRNTIGSKERRIVTGMSSPAGLPSRYILDGTNNYIGKSLGQWTNFQGDPDQEQQPCVSCIGSDRCKFLKPGGKENSYCIAQWLTKTNRGEEGGVYFTGSRLDEILRDPVFWDAEGKPRRPSAEEIMRARFPGMIAA